MPTLTQSDLDNHPDTTLVPVDSISAPAAPADHPITAPDITAPEAVSFTAMDVSEAPTNANFNRPTSTLAADVNEKFGTFATSVTEGLNTLAEETAEALGAVKGEISATQASLLSSVNARLSQIMQNVVLVKASTDDAQDALSRLNEMFGEDVDVDALVAQVDRVKSVLSKLDGADLSIIGALDALTDELNSLARVQQKRFQVVAANGKLVVDLLLAGFGTFASADDYSVVPSAENAPTVLPQIVNKTAESFEIQLKTFGTTIAPMAHNAQANPVWVAVHLSHAKRDPMTLGVDKLNAAYIGDATVTDTTRVNVGA